MKATNTFSKGCIFLIIQKTAKAHNFSFPQVFLSSFTLNPSCPLHPKTRLGLLSFTRSATKNSFQRINLQRPKLQLTGKAGHIAQDILANCRKVPFLSLPSLFTAMIKIYNSKRGRFVKIKQSESWLIFCTFSPVIHTRSLYTMRFVC